MRPRSLFRWLGVLSVLALTACGPQAEPRLIGQHPALPADAIIYTTRLALAVPDVEAAVRYAADDAAACGGYLADAQLWRTAGRPYATVVLAVPAAGFDCLRRALLGLGALLSEDLSSQPRPIGADDWRTYTQITVDFQPAAVALPAPPAWPAPAWDWDPVRTLRQAGAVAFAIFTVAADGLIWLLVVLGPFVLLGWGARALWRRLRR